MAGLGACVKEAQQNGARRGSVKVGRGVLWLALVGLLLPAMLWGMGPQTQGGQVRSTPQAPAEGFESPLYGALLAQGIEKLEPAGAGLVAVPVRHAIAAHSLPSKRAGGGQAAGSHDCSIHGRAPGVPPLQPGANHSHSCPHHSGQHAQACAQHAEPQTGECSQPVLADTTPVAQSRAVVKPQTPGYEQDQASPMYLASLNSSIKKLEVSPAPAEPPQQPPKSSPTPRPPLEVWATRSGYTCNHAYTCALTCENTCAHTCIYTCANTCAYTCANTCDDNTCASTCANTCANTCDDDTCGPAPILRTP